MEKIYLNKELLSDLYKNNIVLPDNPTPEIQRDDSPFVNKTATLLHTGGYLKKILWIHEEPDHPYLSDEDHEMITKILEACKFSWKDIALMNIFGTSADLKELLIQYNPKNLILSVPIKKQLLDIPTNLYSVTNNAKMSVLSTDRLQQIRNDKNLKIKLWSALKQLFEL
jgi:hypothetical protein